jgi:hypothetical protein
LSAKISAILQIKNVPAFLGGETGRKTEKKLKDGVEKDRNRFCCQMRKKRVFNGPHGRSNAE